MTASDSVFFGRSDTFFGICEAMGQDLRISPTLFRVAIGVGVLFHPLATLGVYATAGIVVLATRLAIPVSGAPATAIRCKEHPKCEAHEPPSLVESRVDAQPPLAMAA
jgi:phage shock protein C